MSIQLSNEEFEDRFIISSQLEIIHIFNELARNQEPVSVFFKDKEHLLTTFLSATPEGLVFDLGGDEKSNISLSKSKQCSFIATPNGIRVQFTSLNPKRFLWGSDEAFWVSLPDKVIRLQRRESFRTILPITNTYRCLLKNEVGVILIDTTCHDLCVGGVGINLKSAPPLLLGQTIPQFIIEHEGKFIVNCPATVKHITNLDKLHNNNFQVGFSFVNLPREMDIAIQKAILHITQERKKMLG